MKTEKELIDLATDWKSACWDDSTVVAVDGALYPLRDGKLLNPLDPVNLLMSMPCNDSCNFGAAATYLKYVAMILNTVLQAQYFRKNGYHIISRKDSGAPTVIKTSDEKVHILGEIAKKDNLYYPILCMQLVDDRYNQSSTSPWDAYGFKNPPFYNIETGYDDSHNEDYLETSHTQSHYHIVRKGDDEVLTVTLERVVGKEADIPDPDSYGWIYKDFDNSWFVVEDTSCK